MIKLKSRYTPYENEHTVTHFDILAKILNYFLSLIKMHEEKHEKYDNINIPVISLQLQVIILVLPKKLRIKLFSWYH